MNEMQQLIKISWRGGARFDGLMNWTWPLVKLTLEEDKIEIKAFLKRKIVFEKSQIKEIKIYQGQLSQGLILNSQDSYAPEVIFWSMQIPMILSELEKRNFIISD